MRKFFVLDVTSESVADFSIQKRFYALYYTQNIIRVIKINKNELGGACGTYGREERCIQRFDEET